MPKPSKDDLQFLALLVHRGYLEKFQAEALIPALQSKFGLDELLNTRMDWSDARIAKLRRTRAGEDPEIPGYEIHGRLGVGGTADVFRAREKKTARNMALKVLNPICTRNPAGLKAFITEARLLERLRHPGLVEGYGIAKTGETYFCRLEMVDGKTLLEYLDEARAFEEAVSLRIVLEVAEVLRYMAGEGLVHRDVKPGNIMLDTSGRVKLIDLGFCEIQDKKGAVDTTVGTVHYLSPEQAQGGACADLRSDIYSLGVTLFHLVVGRLPFEDSDDQEVLRKQVMESLKSKELKGRSLSPHLQYFIEKMMAKDADVRYQSWDELIGDIEEQLKGREDLDYARDARDARSRTGSRRRSSSSWRR
ncbi:MAG: serine/threonine protein kinase [Planctomycetota bacterium]|jgi:serine/threonine protein kinase